MHLRWRIFGWLSLATIFVYWGLALPFSLIYLNYDPSQEHWLWLDYLLGTPVLAGFLVFLPIGYWLRPIILFIQGPPPADPQQARYCRQAAEALPLKVFRSIVIASVVGYLWSSLQMGWAAHFPYEEMAKNAVLGAPTGLLAGLLAYFILSAALRPVLKYCETFLPELPEEQPRVYLFWKTWMCFLVVGVVPITVMGLMNYTSSQRQTESSLAAVNLGRLEVLGNQISRGKYWRLGDLFHRRETVGVLTPPLHLTVVKGSDVSQLRSDLNEVVGQSGTIVLRQGSCRILAWIAIHPRQVLVALIPLSDYRQELTQALQSTLLAASVTLLISLGLSWVLAHQLASPVATLTKLARSVMLDHRPVSLTMWHSDDELGQLARAFATMVRRLWAAQDDVTLVNSQLARLVEERTRKVEELRTLFSVTSTLSSNLELDQVMSELMGQLCDMTHADGCSVSLIERDRLVLKACLGLNPLCHPRWDDDAAQADAPRHWLPDQALPARLTEDGIQAVLTIPMKSRGQGIGVIALFDRQLREHSPALLALLGRLARQAGISIENAKLYEEKNQTTELLRRTLIPADPLEFEGLQVAHLYIPSLILSGDYYDLIPLGEGRLGVVMADVAGKGPEAAIQTVRVKHVIRSSALARYSPGRILRHLNQLLNSEGESRTVTVFYAELDLKEGTMCYANAGHEPPLLWNSRRRSWSPLESNGILLGAMDDLEHAEECVEWKPGDCLILYTDGLTEARSAAGGFLGEEPVQVVAERLAGMHPQVIVDQIYLEVDTFTGGNLSDDLSLLVVRFAAPETETYEVGPALDRSSTKM